jgi:hypothetical protein
MPQPEAKSEILKSETPKKSHYVYLNSSLMRPYQTNFPSK